MLVLFSLKSRRFFSLDTHSTGQNLRCFTVFPGMAGRQTVRLHQ